jgi:hypothetical protein
MVLRWQRDLQQCRDVPDDNPSGQAVIAIGSVLVSHADPDGRHCRPAIRTVMELARASQRTVQMSLDWLIEHGWLEVTRKAPRRSTEYRLIIPVYADGHTADQSSVYADGHTADEARVCRGVSLVYAHGHTDLRTSVPKEEEEDDEETSGVGGETSHDMQEVTREIGRAMKRSIGSRPLTEALARAKSITGWSNVALGAYCIEKLRSRMASGAKVGDPSAWLTTDLKKIDDTTVPSPAMGWAEAFFDLDAFDRTWRLAVEKAACEADEEADYTGSPWGCFEQRLMKAELISEGDSVIEWWLVRAADYQGFAQYARMVLMLPQFRQLSGASIPPFVRAPADHQAEGEQS